MQYFLFFLSFKHVSCVSFSFSFLFQFNMMSHVLVFVCVCARSFLYVVVSRVGSLGMCAMLRVKDHFWTEFTIDMEDQMHTMFDAQ